MAHFQPASRPLPLFLQRARRLRLARPGALYNLGNAIGLMSGIALSLVSAGQRQDASSIDALGGYLLGDPGSAALTAATAVFFWSGAVYDRAWAEPGGSARQTALIRRGDLLSAVGAMFLAVSLAFFGSVFLALTSTVLLAGGKLGSALFPSRGWPIRLEASFPGRQTRTLHIDLFRAAVVASRVPAIAALAMATPGLVLHLGMSVELAQNLTLLFCFLIWTSADLLLIRS